ncbi:MAG: SMEK domain-containing protein [Bacteroidales bacterium]|nr:SMEK domain-containing protein [Bacteroidales bacterium]
MIDLRQKAFNSISRVLAITRYDIEQRQLINEYGLNIHGENYFRDVFNSIYDFKLENDNFNSQNSACIDLIDTDRRLAYQITTTRTKKKIENTLKALKKTKYKNYTIKIFYLLDKAKPNKDTIEEFKGNYYIDLNDCLLDYTDLIKKVNDLKDDKLIELDKKYFKNNTEKYTDEIVLNLVFRHLIQNYSKIKSNYDDDFGTIDTNEKMKLNNINPKIANKINNSLDYINIVDSENDLLSDLRILVVDDLYKNILITLLLSKVSKSELANKTLLELNDLCKTYNIDFNKIINNLHINLEEKINIKDFNSMSISWIIISFFFEICDIGIKK